MLCITSNSIFSWFLRKLFVLTVNIFLDFLLLIFELGMKETFSAWQIVWTFVSLFFLFSYSIPERIVTNHRVLCQYVERLTNYLFWIVFDMNRLVRQLTMNNWIERIKKFQKNHIFIYGLPFMTVVLLGPFVLRQFNNVRWVSVFAKFITFVLMQNNITSNKG